MDKNRYKDLEDLLFIGFIPLKAKLGNIDFVFKSINDLEYRKISLMSGVSHAKDYSFKFHYNFLFYSIYLINGVNLLKYREELYTEVVFILKDLPSVILKKVFDELQKISSRLDKCTQLVEPYTYESISRHYWRSRSKFSLNRSEVTGIVGTESLGLNQFQRFWMILNEREDHTESFEEKYSLFKFLASFTDCKSVKKIDASDKAKKEEDLRKKERIKLMGLEEEKKYSFDPTDTREGIVEELEKQIKGVKDDHDLAIESYERKLRSNMLKQMQEIKEMQDKKQKESSLMEETRVISSEEMMERLNRNKNSPKIYMKAIDDHETKYMEMSNIKTEDVLEESGLTKKSYNNLISKEMFKNSHKPLEDDSEVIEEYLTEQKRLANKMGFDEDTNFDFPNLRTK